MTMVADKIADKPTISVPKHRAPDAAPHLDRTYTANELLRFPSRWHYELIEGYLRPLMPTGGLHGTCAVLFAAFTSVYVAEKDLGAVFAAESGFLLKQNPDTVLEPDFAFVTKAWMPPLTAKFVAAAPDSALETRSPGDRKAGIEEKIAEWFSFGVSYVLDLDPARRTLAVHRSGVEPAVLGAGDTFVAEDILLGFALRLERIFPVP